VLLSSDASADTLRALVASGVTATRPALGTEARTNGPFASSLHARVLPDFLDVADDPLVTSYAGKGLVGAYAVDDEGVPAQAVKLVTAGRLENYLIGREPVRDFPQSNGHGRAGLAAAPRPAIGVLQVTAKDGVTDEELNSKLLALAKDRGLKVNEYGVFRGDEQIAKRLHGHRDRRWVVERLHSWMNRFRRILVRWEKKADNYQAFLHLACAYITWNQT